MGSSTGDMLVDDKKVLEEIFEKSPIIWFIVRMKIQLNITHS